MNIKNKLFNFISLILSSFNLLMFFALRPCWSGISKTLGYTNGGSNFILYFPVMICILLLIILIINILFLVILKDNKKIGIIFSIIGLAFLIGIIAIIILGAIDYMRFVMRNFITSLVYVIILLALLALIFIYPKTKLKNNTLFKISFSVFAFLIFALYITNANINYLSYEPVVYAVEDEYQIVFSSNANSLGYITIGDKEYDELSSGSKKSKDKIHKVCVPMEELDEIKKYTIHLEKVIYRGPFGGILGKEIKKDYSFTPVDTSDGLTYFSISDVHMNISNAIKTVNKQEEFDFLVINGDTISMVDSASDCNYVNKMAYEMTKGSIPVIYARGNHECKGNYSEELYKYVGSVNEKFYYNVYFKDCFITVLDLGEDHDDDWWEFYTTANYNEYHNEQVQFLEDIIDKKEYETYKYNLCICHIPLTFVNNRLDHENIKNRMTDLLNEMGIDMLLCGHQHQLYIFEPNLIEPKTNLKYNTKFYENKTYKGYVTDFEFLSLMVSKPGYTQTDDTNLSTSKSHIGLRVEVDLINNIEKCRYYNSNNEIVSIVNPFYEKDYGTEIVYNYKTNTIIK